VRKVNERWKNDCDNKINEIEFKPDSKFKNNNSRGAQIEPTKENLAENLEETKITWQLKTCRNSKLISRSYFTHPIYEGYG
jgi:hypothetical protein